MVTDMVVFTRILSHPLVAFALRAILGGYLIYMGRVYYADTFGLFSRIGAAASLRSVGQAGSSRGGRLLSLGRMLHSRRGDCHADS